MAYLFYDANQGMPLPNCLYLLAAGVLRQVVEKCVAGASVVDLCELGDRLILEETSKVYKKEKEMKKGRVRESCCPHRSSGINYTTTKCCET